MKSPAPGGRKTGAGQPRINQRSKLSAGGQASLTLRCDFRQSTNMGRTNCDAGPNMSGPLEQSGLTLCLEQREPRERLPTRIIALIKDSAGRRVLRQAPDGPADALVRAMARRRTAGAGRTHLIDATAIHPLLISSSDASASASPSLGPGNGILRAETGGGFQAQNAGERPEFCSQTALRLANRPKLREFLWTRKPRRFVAKGIRTANLSLMRS